MSDFIKVCNLDDLIKDSGVAALVNNVQVALFYIGDEVFALNNFDPIGQAYVMSRGMIGDLKGQLMVASPLQKQHYNLQTGECMDIEGVQIPTYESKIEDSAVWVKMP
ncbi:nitrite reductase small subunit NirD [Thiomicrorhabdus sediminis]|uniref:Nitrite reductase small subunit NirD n=1 Tax=Thiomicrorhabdus sediminis TaxID=2580412 RepID=A0A4V1HHU4_9GAMM|nr:nitrite reductase small subunit NirD [Thiomicrorhabdus sediminis]QCU90233.1 nitrite reductase small subunit NirD [Thiomicrorhabdus sediminis]